MSDNKVNLLGTGVNIFENILLSVNSLQVRLHLSPVVDYFTHNKTSSIGTCPIEDVKTLKINNFIISD